MTCTRFVVSGRVQGVFYRASVQEEATRLGLVGWTRNQADGSVELLACGADESLAQLQRWLWDGPALADVTSVEVELRAEIQAEIRKGLTDFSIRY